MYQAPSDFVSQLDAMFHGRFRIRWSDKRHEFQLEQKVHTGQVMMPPPIDPDAPDHFDTYSDEWIRARDGYFLTMSLRNGDRMPCPVCGLTVPVPVMETRESMCEHCKAHGRDGRYIAAFYPEWNHILLEHIRAIDPLSSDINRTRKAMRARQIEKMERDNRMAVQMGEDAVIDNKNQVEDNPMTGYGPKTAQHTAERFYDAGRELAQASR